MRTLQSNQKIGYAAAALSLVALLAALAAPASLIRLIAAAVFVLAAVATCAFVKKRSILSFNKRQVLLLLSVIAAVYLMLYYLTGLYFGYAAIHRALSFDSLWQFILPLSLIIVCSEIIRSVLLAQNSRLISVLVYLIGVLSELLMAGGVQEIDSIYQLMDFLGMVLFPALTANLLYQYISKRYGFWPNIVYRLILTLYVYLIPFAPNAPAVLPAFALLLLPLIAYAFIDMLFEKKRRMARHKKSKWRFVPIGAVLILMVAFVMLISCRFRFGAIVIATESMTGEINRGDVVIYETAEHHVIEENDVIVFSKDANTRVIHRVIEVEVLNGQRRYITKGDANDAPDLGYVTEDQIIGEVRLKALYIGYPSLWLREIFK